MFDLILHFFVFEHIVDPSNFIKKLLGLLKLGEQIIFEVPSADDPLHSLFDIPEFERFYWSRAHPYYYTETSLNYVLTKLECGFRIEKHQRYDISNHFTWALDRKSGGQGKYANAFGDEFHKLYSEALLKGGYCDTLIVEIKRGA